MDHKSYFTISALIIFVALLVGFVFKESIMIVSFAAAVLLIIATALYTAYGIDN